jgi:hypothetical protein
MQKPGTVPGLLFPNLIVSGLSRVWDRGGMLSLILTLRGNEKTKYRDLSTAAAKGATFGRDDVRLGGFGFR